MGIGKAIGQTVATACLAMVTVAFLVETSHALDPPTPQEYVDHVGGGAKVIPPGRLKIDGRRVICGRRPTVLDSNLDD